MSEPGSLRLIAEHLAGAVAPLERAFRDETAFRTLMRRLGWSVRDLPVAYVAIADGAAAAVAALDALAEDAELPALLELIDRVGSVYRSLDGLAVAPGGVDAAAFRAEIGREWDRASLVRVRTGPRYSRRSARAAAHRRAPPLPAADHRAGELDPVRAGSGRRVASRRGA